jgi:hypothetical protein
MSRPTRAQDLDARDETLRSWAAAIAADFPVPGPELADRLVNLLLPTRTDLGSKSAQQGA